MIDTEFYNKVMAKCDELYSEPSPYGSSIVCSLKEVLEAPDRDISEEELEYFKTYNALSCQQKTLHDEGFGNPKMAIPDHHLDYFSPLYMISGNVPKSSLMMETVTKKIDLPTWWMAIIDLMLDFPLEMELLCLLMLIQDNCSDEDFDDTVEHYIILNPVYYRFSDIRKTVDYLINKYSNFFE